MPGKSKPAAEAAPPPPPPAPKKAKLSYKDQRDYELLPQQIDALLAQIARDEAAMADPALYTRDPAKFAALTAAIAKARPTKTPPRNAGWSWRSSVEG